MWFDVMLLEFKLATFDEAFRQCSNLCFSFLVGNRCGWKIHQEPTLRNQREAKGLTGRRMRTLQMIFQVSTLGDVWSWGWGLLTSVLTDETHKSAVPGNTFRVWICNRNIVSQVLMTWLGVTLHDCPEGLESWLIFDDNLFKAGERSFPMRGRSSMCGRRLLGWTGSFQLSSEAKRKGREGEGKVWAALAGALSMQGWD